MKGKCVMFFICLFFVSQSVYASSPLCLKEDVLLDGFVVITNENINQYLEVCPWFKKRIEDFQKQSEAQTDHTASIIAYMLGKNLRYSKWQKNRDSALLYIQYSFDLAFKHGISLEEHLETLRSVDR